MHIIAKMNSDTQLAYPSDGLLYVRVELPSPDCDVLAGVRWGEAGGLFSPAYWAAHCHLVAAKNASPQPHRLGRTLLEELAACLLGGYGMSAELGLAAYSHVRDGGLLRFGVTAGDLEHALSQPLEVTGRMMKYRYPRQRSVYLAGCIRALEQSNVPTDARALRSYLCELPGIGPKTASWIVRNWLDSDEVAILDVHILRAMSYLKLVGHVAMPKDYERVEAVFLGFANALGVRASILDALMWQHMRRWGYLIDSKPRSICRSVSRERRPTSRSQLLVNAGDD